MSTGINRNGESTQQKPTILLVGYDLNINLLEGSFSSFYNGYYTVEKIMDVDMACVRLFDAAAKRGCKTIDALVIDTFIDSKGHTGIDLANGARESLHQDIPIFLYTTGSAPKDKYLDPSIMVIEKNGHSFRYLVNSVHASLLNKQKENRRPAFVTR